MKTSFFDKSLQKIIVAFIMCMIFGTTTTVLAVTRTWVGASTGGSWEVGSNWSGGLVPGTTDEADITSIGTITVSSTVTVGRLVLRSTTGGQAKVLINSNGNLTVDNLTSNTQNAVILLGTTIENNGVFTIKTRGTASAGLQIRAGNGYTPGYTGGGNLSIFSYGATNTSACIDYGTSTPTNSVFTILNPGVCTVIPSGGQSVVGLASANVIFDGTGTFNVGAEATTVNAVFFLVKAGYTFTLGTSGNVLANNLTTNLYLNSSNASYAPILANGTFINHGTINFPTAFVGFAFNLNQSTSSSPIFTNNGAINFDVGNNCQPFYLNSSTTSSPLLTNNGTIFVTSAAEVFKYSLTNTYGWDVVNNGTITSNSNTGSLIGISGAAIGKAFTNNGTINSSNTGIVINSSVVFNNNGLLTLGASTITSANAGGIFYNNTGGVVNFNYSSANTVALGTSNIAFTNKGGQVEGNATFPTGAFIFDANTPGTLSPGGNAGYGILNFKVADNGTFALKGLCKMNAKNKSVGTGAGAAGIDFDQVQISSSTNLAIVNLSGASLQLTIDPTYTPANGDLIGLFYGNNNGLSGTLNNVSMPNGHWSMDYANTNDLKVGYAKFSSSTVPNDCFKSAASGNWSSNGSWQSSYDNLSWVSATAPPTSAASSVSVLNGHTITVVENATSGLLTINSGGKLTLNETKTLSVTGDFIINSDGSNGTGTFVDLTTDGGLTVSGTTTVQQYLTSSAIGVAGRNWYISSPLSAASSSTITTATGNGLVYYDGTSNWPDAGLTMDIMKGYIAKSPAQNTTITFSGGALNTGVQTLNNLPVGFNLVGNPYPSYVSWTEATKSNVTNSIWYRSKKTGSYNFHTYNVTGGVGVNDGTDIIPPMQSFWIKTTSATNSLIFTNAMRSHQDQSIETNRLKAPKVNTQKLLRLQVSNGTDKDEAVVYFNSDAQNTTDDFDTQKMFNNIADFPEIYTQIGTEKLVINGMNEVQYDTEIPLGFNTLQTNNFSIIASEFNNFDNNTLIILKDKERSTEQDLTNGTVYNFESGVTNTSDRFSLIFRIKDTATELTNNSKELNVKVFVNAQNQIILIAPEICSYAVYSAIGQKQLDGILESTEESINKHFNPGVYFVELSQNGLHEIKKVVIR